jgi:hypothetical protein
VTNAIEPEERVVLRFVVIATVMLIAPVPLAAQFAVGARYGEARGSAVYHVGEVHARLHVVGRLAAVGVFEIMGGNWACPLSPTTSIICGYDGRSISLGPSLALFTMGRMSLAARATAGWFERTGTHGDDEYHGSDHATLGLGIDAELGVVGPLRLQAAVTHRRIYDRVYENAAGVQPHLTAVMFGLVVGFGRY